MLENYVGKAVTVEFYMSDGQRRCWIKAEGILDKGVWGNSELYGIDRDGRTIATFTDAMVKAIENQTLLLR